MDIYFNYPQGDSSIYELTSLDSVVAELYDHVMTTKDYKDEDFTIAYDGEVLIDRDMPLHDVIKESNQFYIRTLCNDPLCAMSIRENKILIDIYREEVVKRMKYTNEHHLDCVAYLAEHPLNLSSHEVVWYVRNIPDNFKTPNICSQAVCMSPSSIMYVPGKYITGRMCNLVLRDEPSNFKHIPQEYLTQSMCDLAIDYEPDLIEHIPKRFITQEIRDRVVLFGHLISH